MISKQQEESLFEAARNLSSPSARQTFLASACEGDAELRERVESLLAEEVEADKFFKIAAPPSAKLAEYLSASDREEESPAPSQPGEVPASIEGLGTRIAQYKLLQKIGEGGCGYVYMAEQETPIRRRVALKIIKLGMDTKNVIARFEAERQALAMMDHINIARVFDAGATETGRPFFVMELVRGVKITDYCDQNHLDTRERLNLFIQICHAIQHAHQKGIIHRDIKPSNILVTLHDGVPVPKVIDFGIAKATEARLTDKTLFTAYEQMIGTPAYMSPEQAEMSGLDIDTRSDIYSLGVLLYELLTGKTPFDPKKLLQSGLEEMRRTIREREPQRPSTFVTTLQGEELTAVTQQRQVELPKLISLLRGDLDWIVMKALDKDRKRRYETANGLAMDIQRYLHNEPVTARPPSRFYRFQKLVRRNKGVFVGVGAVSIALIAGFGTSTVLFFRERAERQRAELAEAKQSALFLQAEQMRANETQLRREAENREKVTLAAVRVKDGDFDGADTLLSSIGTPKPSLEVAEVLRSLGDWYALQDRWQAASERFTLLSQVNGISGWDLASLDLLRQGVVLVEMNHLPAYENFRAAALSQSIGMTNAISAERVVKICLLRPADQKILSQLKPLADSAAKTFSIVATNADSEAAFQAAWGSISLALMEYRLGNFPQAETWCRQCLAYPGDNPPRIATARVILGMAAQKLGDVAEATAELTKSREAIETSFAQGLNTGSADRGFWFDWIFARILLNEVTSSPKPTAQK